jgi:hypothetical protein
MSHSRSSAAHVRGSADCRQHQPQPQPGETFFRSGSGMAMFFGAMLVALAVSVALVTVMLLFHH